MKLTTPGRKPCAARLLTTCHVDHDGTEDLLKLVASADQALRAGELSDLGHIILLQGCDLAGQERMRSKLPRWVQLFSTEERLSASRARNAMLEHLLAHDLLGGDGFVGFPDDDAWYAPGSLHCIAQSFARHASADFLVARRGSQPSAEDCSIELRPSFQTVISNASCNSMFLRRRLLDRLPGFDERLGLGTILAGGEDTELAIRAFNLAPSGTIYLRGVVIGHATPDASKKAKYYEGGLAAILAHTDTSLAARRALLRKLAVGAWLSIRGHLTARGFFSAIRRARRNASLVRDRTPLDRHG